MSNWHEDFEDETFPPEMFDEEPYPDDEDEGLYDMEDGDDEDYPIGMDDEPEYDEDDDDDEPHDMTDVEADADTLRNCGWGTDEDYGYYGDGDEW